MTGKAQFVVALSPLLRLQDRVIGRMDTNHPFAERTLLPDPNPACVEGATATRADARAMICQPSGFAWEPLPSHMLGPLQARPVLHAPYVA